jgi:serine/threonine protein kinase
MSDPASNEVEQLFLDLLDLPVEARAGHLEKRCGKNEELKKLVSRLLEADSENQSDNSLDSPVAQAIEDPAPSRVGSYRVTAIAGEGGMGAVYDCVHEPTGRRAAVKLIRAGVATAQGRERLRIEAETLARLNDPGIAQLYDAGVADVTWLDGTPSRRPFIAMEFVEQAATLLEHVRTHSLSLRARVALMEQVVRAVHHAHQRGVIHRDLKPGNVLVTPDGKPKVVDFGIARLIDSTADGVTVTGQVLGTLRYMSPEQLNAQPQLLDTRTDIYSLGAILYELLASRPLIELDSGSSLAAAVQLIGTPPARLATIKPEYRGDLDAIVHKAIERDPNDRYESASAFADDLERFLDGREVSARAPTTIERFVRTVRHNKGRFAGAAVVLLSLLAGTVFATWGMVRAERARRDEAEQRRVAELNEQKAKSAEADSKAFSEFLVNRVLATARPQGMQEGLGVDVKVVDAIAAAEKHLATDFANRPAAEAVARRAIGVTWRYRGDLEKAEKHVRRAAELAESSLGPGHELTLDIRNSLVVLLQQMDRNTEGVATQDAIVRGLEAALGPHHRRTIGARYNLAIYRAKSGDYATALKELERVHADRAVVVGADNAETLSTLSDIAEIHMHLGAPEKAVRIQEEMLSKLRGQVGDDHPQLLTAQYRLAFLYQRTGNYDRAARLLEQSLPGLRKTLGEGNITTLDAMAKLSQCYLALRDFDRAIPLIRDYAAGQSRLTGERSPQTGLMLSSCAIRLLLAEQFAAAEEFARKSLLLHQEIAPKTLPFLESQCLLGQSLRGQGRFEPAEPLLVDGLAGLDQQAELPKRYRECRQQARQSLIALYESTGRADQAKAQRALLPEQPPSTAATP